MAFFDEIGKTLADKSREAAKKAKDVAEILQLKAQISTEKSKTKGAVRVHRRAVFQKAP